MNTMMQKYAFIPSDAKRGEKTTNQDVESEKNCSTFNATNTEKIVRLKSTISIKIVALYVVNSDLKRSIENDQ